MKKFHCAKEGDRTLCGRNIKGCSPERFAELAEQWHGDACASCARVLGVFLSFAIADLDDAWTITRRRLWEARRPLDDYGSYVKFTADSETALMQRIREYEKTKT